MRRAIGVIGICTGVFAVAASLTFAQAPAAGGPGRGGPQQNNLQVLPKNWTGQQVRAVMSTFTESLGVQCSHCHSVDPTAPPPAAGRGPALDYALDGKPEKDISRKMIQMVMALNEDTKGLGDTAVVEKVTCYTCHAGSATPARQPAAGWGRGGFSLLPAGPPAAPARGAGAAPAGRGGN